MIRFLEENYRDFIPASCFSYAVLGLLSGLFFESFLPDLLLPWTAIGALAIPFLRSHKRSTAKTLSFCLGILFFFLLLSFGPSKRSAPLLEESKIWKEASSRFVESRLDRGGIQGLAKEISLGLVLGDSRALNKEFKQNAKEGGILHLFAASGLHLGILLASIYAFLKRIPSLGFKFPRIFPVCVGWMYLAALGFPMSLARAWVFSSVLLLQNLAYRKQRSVDLLLGSIGILYFWDPSRSFGVSFLLSFGAVGSILLLKPSLDLCLPEMQAEDNRLGKIVLFLRENLTVSLAAGFGTFPVLVHYFGAYSFGSLGLNLLVVPLCGILLPLLYSVLFLEFLRVPFLKETAWVLVNYLLEILGKLTVTWADLEWSIQRFYLADSKEKAILLWVLFLLFLIGLRCFRKRKLESNGMDRKTFGKNPPAPSKIPFLFRIPIWIFSLPICISFHFLLAGIPEWKQFPSVFFGDRFTFVLRNGKELALGGKCKYSKKMLKEAFGKYRVLVCGTSPLEKAYAEDESCAFWISLCVRKKRPLRFEYGITGTRKAVPPEGWDVVAKRKEFYVDSTSLRMIRFEVGKDSLADLLQKTKQGSGIILLVPRYRSRDDPEDWNRFRKRLGIADGWKFIGGNELPGIPVL